MQNRPWVALIGDMYSLMVLIGFKGQVMTCLKIEMSRACFLGVGNR